MSSNDETKRDPNLEDEERSDAPAEGEESSPASETVSESEESTTETDSAESSSEPDQSVSAVASSASRPMSAGARLAAQKAAKAVLKAQKKDERTSASTPDQEPLEGEVVDSAEAAPEVLLDRTELGRATLRAGDWWAANSQLALGAVVAVGVGLAGFLGYRLFTENAAVGAGSLLEEAVEAANAPIEAEPAGGSDAVVDDTLSFPTAAARDEAALAAYQRVISEHGDTEAAAFARLGAARALVALGRGDEARPLYQAAADRGGANGTIGLQALEGIGFLQEAADDLAGAQATYERLGLLADRRFEPVSKYHLARLQITRGEDDAARTALRELVSELRAAGEDAPEPEFPYVLAQAEMRLRELDPSTSAATPSFGGGRGAGADLDPQIQEMLRRLQAEQAAGGGAGGGE